MKQRSWRALGWMVCGLAAATLATETENHGLSVLPTPGPVVVDGRFGDWDLSGGIFAVNDVENLRQQYGVWFHAMYDARNLYLLARWNDPTPLDNPGSTKGDHGFQGDCLQVRFITHYQGQGGQERVAHLTCWRDRDELDVIDISYGRDFKGGHLRDAREHGAEQAFAVYENRRGYVQELSLPWALLTADGKPLAAGAELRLAVEPNYTAGAGGRVSIKDSFQPNLVPDRVFTFRAYNNWGTARLEVQGNLPPRPVRLADGREFPVRLEDGLPSVDWSGLIAVRELPGFKPIRFAMPVDGYVSLNLYDHEGVVVRQLLNWAFYTRGEHDVLWDGLTTPQWRRPGQPVAVGDYSWRGLVHPGLGLRLRGWASNAGSAPWDAGPTTNWGGDHGVPSAAAADATHVYLGWTGSEAGKALVAVDLDGKVRWKHTRGGMGGASLVGVDGGIVYVADHERVVYRLEAATGGYSSWAGRPVADVAVASLWPDRRGMPDRLAGLDAGHGKLYLTTHLPPLRGEEVLDWPGLLARVFARLDLGAVVFDRLHDHWQRQAANWGDGPDDLDAFCRGPRNVPELRGHVVDILNRLLAEENLVAMSEKLEGHALRAFNRRHLESAFPGAFVPARGNFLAVLNGQTAQVERLIDLELPGFVRAVAPDRLLVLAGGGRRVVEVNPLTGAARTLVDNLEQAQAVTTDGAGRLLVSLRGVEQCVRIFSPDGRALGTVGQPGGRPELGPWQADGMRHPAGLVVDASGTLWVAEATNSPKRFSRWDLATGKLLREFFGPTHYGASGGAIHPRDPNLMVGEGCEWRLDPATGRDLCLGVFDNAIHGAALFAEGGNGRLYLVTAGARGAFIDIRERLGDGDYAMRASIRRDSERKVTTFWADADGDGQPQPEEIQSWPGLLRLAGYLGWSININTDLTLYVTDEGMKTGHQIPVAGFTAAGAPLYDLANTRTLPALAGATPTPDNRLVLAVDNDWFRCYEVATGALRWSYPNTFSGVHGSHRAPPPEPGLTRGAFGAVGSAILPAPVGGLWAVNGNCGEWYAFTEDGFFLSQLFQGDPFKQKYPDQAVPGAILDACPPGSGGEDFGGSLRQGADGKVYLQAGKTALWNAELVGLDQVRGLPGSTVTITAADLEAAARCREEQLQAAEGERVFTIRRGTPTFTGSLDKDFPGDKASFRKQDNAAVKIAAAWDDDCLYLGWEVRDDTPWINGADAPELIYARGDTVDFQLGTNPQAAKDRRAAVAGDLRLSIGNFQGKPTAVLYRQVATVKAPKVFSSGVVAEFAMDFVQVLADVRLEVKVDERGRRYTVQAAVPLAALGFVPAPGLGLRGDFGATHGDAAGVRTALRTHWNNQQTGLVNDEVFELKMAPANWGAIIFQP